MHVIEESASKLVIHLDPKEAQEIASNLLEHAELLGGPAAGLGRMLHDAGYALPPDEPPHYEHHNPLED